MASLAMTAPLGQTADSNPDTWRDSSFELRTSPFPPLTTPFYAPPDAFDGDRVRLPDDEARHASRVLRHAVGDVVAVVDGVGGWHTVRLDRVAKDRAEGVVVETRYDAGEPASRVIVGLAPLKSADRMAFAVEKAVELGVTDVLLLDTARTEGRIPKPERLHALAVAAMKQTLRSRLVRFHPVRQLGMAQFLADTGETFLPVLLHEAAPDDAPFPTLLAQRGRSVVPLVGPEGGFTPEEVDAARASGWPVASLGPRRLRAETAFVAVCALHLAARISDAGAA